jgi:alpha-1,3-rhamnosyl/mannosyltransferase
VHYLGVDPAKVIVTPLGVDEQIKQSRPTQDAVDRVCAIYGVRRPYILTVGGLGPHKNLLGAVRALSVLHRVRETKELTLVIAGRDYGSRREIENAVASLSLNGSVAIAGYVTRDHLTALYAGALVYVSPSHYEGFGLTVLEAMAMGVPVVASRKGSLPEVAGHAALFVEPDDTRGLVESVGRVISEPPLRASLVAAGYRRSEEFSWKRTAELTRRCYYDAANVDQLN